MAITTVVIYVAVMLTAVLYSGGLTIHTIFGLELTTGVWILAVIAALYTTWGGLKAVAWADLFQGLALLAGGLLVFFLGLHAVGGWNAFARVNADKLHMILPADNPDLPWTGVASGSFVAPDHADDSYLELVLTVTDSSGLENTVTLELRPLEVELRVDSDPSGLLVAVNDGRASVAVGVTDDKTGSHSAVDLVKAAVAALGGQGGGGRPDMAQGGGPDGGAANDAVAAVKAALA